MACCTRPTGMSPHVQELTHKKLKEVATYYPGTYFAVVLGATGELVSFHNDGVARPESVMQSLADMKRAALEFGTVVVGCGVEEKGSGIYCCSLQRFVILCPSEFPSIEQPPV